MPEMALEIDLRNLEIWVWEFWNDKCVGTLWSGGITAETVSGLIDHKKARHW